MHAVTFRVTANHSDHEESASDSVEVGIFDYAELSHLKAIDQNDLSRYSEHTLQVVSRGPWWLRRTADITAHKDRELPWPENEPVWWGLEEAQGVDSVTYTGTRGGKQFARVGVDRESVGIDIVCGATYIIAVSTENFQALKDILTEIQDALGGGKLTFEFRGGGKWHYVDQARSPLVQRSVLLTARGNFKLSQRFPVPKLYWDFGWVEAGVFVEPGINLNLGVGIKRDGSSNPVEWAGTGGAGLGGSITAGLGAEIYKHPDVGEWFRVEVSATAAIGGEFGVHVSPTEQKLTGSYYVELAATAIIKVDFGWWEDEVRGSISWPVVCGTATVDLSTHFN